MVQRSKLKLIEVCKKTLLYVAVSQNLLYVGVSQILPAFCDEHLFVTI